MLIASSGNPLIGDVYLEGEDGLPGDKSISHRSALFAALAFGDSIIDNFQVSGVTQPMLLALRTLGIDWELAGQRLSIQGKGIQGFHRSIDRIDCANSGTTLRLLTGALCASGSTGILDGSEGLRRRPMKRIVDPLRKMGVTIKDTGGCAPLQIREIEHPLRALDISLPVASAQVKSCLLLAALKGNGCSIISEPGPSRDHSERMLKSMGVDIHSSVQKTGDLKQYVTEIQPLDRKELLPLTMKLPGDFSSAAFIIVAASITPGSEVTIHDVGLNPTRTGLLDALMHMGADISITCSPDQGGEAMGNITIRSGDLTGIEVDGERVVRMIDEFPVFAIAAAAAGGETTVSQAKELRFKESDRISDLCRELSRIGVDVREKEDGFVIRGGKKLSGGVVDSHGDHRLAMSLAVAGLVTGNDIVVNDAAIIAESFPSFVHLFRKLGAKFRTN